MAIMSDRWKQAKKKRARLYRRKRNIQRGGYKQHTIRHALLADLDGWLVRRSHRVIDLNETMLEPLLTLSHALAAFPVPTVLSTQVTDPVRGTPRGNRSETGGFAAEHG